jgi:hypothetical protein
VGNALEFVRQDLNPKYRSPSGLSQEGRAEIEVLHSALMLAAEAARMSRKERNCFTGPKALLLALFPALIITALPYLTYLTKLPFTRYEMKVLCWFPGEVVVAEIWQLPSKAASEDIVGTYAFYVVSQVCNVLLYTMFFYICLRLPAWFSRIEEGGASDDSGSDKSKAVPGLPTSGSQQKMD